MGHHSVHPSIGSYNPHPAYNHNHRAQLPLTQRPHAEQPYVASGGVTIEELPASDNEEEEAGNRDTPPAPTGSSGRRQLPSIPRVGRRNAPKEPRPSSKTSKRTKKY